MFHTAFIYDVSLFSEKRLARETSHMAEKIIKCHRIVYIEILNNFEPTRFKTKMINDF